MPRHLKIALILAVAVALIAAGIASAHADFTRSDPAPNAVLEVAPARVTIGFTEPIEPGFSTITVLFQDGSTADLGDSAVAPADPTELSVSLGDTREGTYLVSWRVLSAVDGHITSGSWVYSVGQPIDRTVTAQTGGASTSPLDMIARALLFVGQAVFVGTLLFRWLVWWPALKSADLDAVVDEPAIRRGRIVVFVALALACAGAVLSLLAQSSAAGASIGAWMSTRVGRVWIGRAMTLIALAMLGNEVASAKPVTRSPRTWTGVALAWLGLQLLLLTSLTSHSAAIANPPIIPVLADWLHLTASAVWAGGLAQMAFVVPFAARSIGDDEDRAWLWLKAVVYFSTVAAVGIGILLVTGAYMSFLHVGDWPAVLTTVYGRSLLLKLMLAGVAMLIGAFNLFVIKPRLDRAVDAPDESPARALQQRFKRLVSFEAVAALSVLAAAGILTALPRSKDPQPLASSQRLELRTRADPLDVALGIDPATTGFNTFDIRLTQNDRRITDAKSVSLRFTFLTRSVGTTAAEAQLTPDGAYTTSGAFLSLAGDWQIEIAVRRPDAFDTFAAYRVKVGLDGRIGPESAADPIEAASRWLSIYGLPFGGVVAILLGTIWLLIALKAARNTVSQVVLMIPALIGLPIGLLSVVTFFREATPGLTLANPYLPDEQSIAIGAKLFAANCAACHGPEGRGNGPAAASLSVRPPDYGNGHLDIHTDGDIFYWVQNGFPSNVMPAFKDRLTEDETWHLVNYVRRLRNLAGETSASSPSEPIASLQPYTPPSFIAPEAGASATPHLPTPSAPSDAEAIALLRQSDAAMNALTSLVEDQTIRDDQGNQLSVRFEYNAPDRLRYQIANGAASIQIGTRDFQLDPDGNWIENQRAVPFRWPDFTYAQVAGGARIDQNPPGALPNTRSVAFEYDGFNFRVWIGPAYRIVQLTMDGPNHHMISKYSAFDAAPKIEPPIP